MLGYDSYYENTTLLFFKAWSYSLNISFFVYLKNTVKYFVTNANVLFQLATSLKPRLTNKPQNTDP